MRRPPLVEAKGGGEIDDNNNPLFASTPPIPQLLPQMEAAAVPCHPPRLTEHKR